MARITWGDDSIRTRLFRTALQLSTLFLRYIRDFDPAGSELSPLTLLEMLDKRWQLLADHGDQLPEGYCQAIRADLLSFTDKPGYSVFRKIREELGNGFSCDQRLLDVNDRAFEEVGKCVRKWGGPKAKNRFLHLRPISVHCETAENDGTEIFFDREDRRLLVRSGPLRLLLLECIVLEFSFFHEYLSHSFPLWGEDQEEFSEGFLFALEFDWFQFSYTPIDFDLLQRLWHSRLDRNRHTLRCGQWFLRRCESSPNCARRFLLEWVASWPDYPRDLHADLMSQLLGFANKVGSRLGGLRKKDEKVLESLTRLLCTPCRQAKWDLNATSHNLADVLKEYEPIL